MAVLAGILMAGGDAVSTQAQNSMQITTTAFKEHEAIPARFTCQGENVSPALSWSGMPANAKSLVLICDDPDAPSGTWTHWVVYDLPSSASELPENVSRSATISGGGKQGMNDFRQIGYGGPCPPSGKPHRYFFRLYALNSMLELRPGARRSDVEAAIGKHLLASAEVFGTYQRR